MKITTSTIAILGALSCSCLILASSAETATAAGSPSTEQFIEGLAPPRTRGIQLMPASPAATTQPAASSTKVPEIKPSIPIVTTQPKQATPPPGVQSAPSVIAKINPEESTKAPQMNLQLTFQYNSAALSDETKTTLNKLGQAMQDSQLKPYRFMIEGHTDSKGGAAYNWELSLRRAASIKRYLMEQHGVTPQRLDVVGKGESEPRFPGDPTAAGNRRVVIINIGAG